MSTALATDLDHRPRATVTPLPILPRRTGCQEDKRQLVPPRLNYAGHCVVCFEYGCQSANSMKQYEQAEWVTCRHCDGSGLNVTDDQICDCLGGLVDMAGSGWSQRVAPRPSRLNFAGYCIWCDERWCEEAECVERHTHSHWDVCDRCDGLGYDEPTGPPAVAPTDSLKRPSQTDDQPHRF